MVDTVAGLAATATENWGGAEQHFERGISRAERIGHRFVLPGARQSYAEMLIARSAPGDNERASVVLRQVMDEYRAMGMTVMPAHAEPLLATLRMSNLAVTRDIA